MTTVTFNTHKFIRKLETAGFDTRQAEAMTEALAEVLDESTSATLASKQDILALKEDISVLRLEMRELQHWLETKPEAFFEQEIAYRGTDGKARRNWVRDVLTHMMGHMVHHRGQISFPGGACEAHDNDLLDTALRETHEEIGVPPEAVEVLGALDDFPTITHFVVTPFVGVIPHPFAYRISEIEVEAVVEVPLSFLLEPTHVRMEEREHEGQIYELLFWDYREGERTYTIWGATARTLRGFLDLIS